MKPPLARMLGKLVRRQRERRGLTVTQAAELVDMQQPVYSRIEHGHKLITLPTVRRLVDALGLDVHEVGRCCDVALRMERGRDA